MQEGVGMRMVEFEKLHSTRLNHSMRLGGQRPTPGRFNAIPAIEVFCAAKKNLCAPPCLRLICAAPPMLSIVFPRFSSVFVEKKSAHLAFARQAQRSSVSSDQLFGVILDNAIGHSEIIRSKLGWCQHIEQRPVFDIGFRDFYASRTAARLIVE